MEKIFKVVVAAIVAVAVVLVMATVLCLLCAIPTLILWNWLMPVLFGVTKITFWQAVGINALTSTLFKTHNFSRSKKD